MHARACIRPKQSCPLHTCMPKLLPWSRTHVPDWPSGAPGSGTCTTNTSRSGHTAAGKARVTAASALEAAAAAAAAASAAAAVGSGADASRGGAGATSGANGVRTARSPCCRNTINRMRKGDGGARGSHEAVCSGGEVSGLWLRPLPCLVAARPRRW
jgi:hypothetical protein